MQQKQQMEMPKQEKNKDATNGPIARTKQEELELERLTWQYTSDDEAWHQIQMEEYMMMMNQELLLLRS